LLRFLVSLPGLGKKVFVKAAPPWIEEKGVEYQIAIGDEGLAREFGVLGFPTLAIISPDGNIESLHVGLIEAEELEQLVAPLIGAS